MDDFHREMFNRNLGNVTEAEQDALLRSTVAIAGVGGVGGAAAFNLVRMGIGKVKIADPEVFGYSDLNRQQGSTYAKVGAKKVEVLREALQAINPKLEVETYPEGITVENLGRFLQGADIVIDCLEFWMAHIRKALYDRCRERGLFALCCPIFGFGTALGVYDPKGLTFDEIFGPVPDKMDTAYAVSFGRSFFPVFPRYVNLGAYIEAMRKNRPIPSLASSCSLSGAVTAAEAVTLLLGKRKPLCWPYVRHYDLFEAKVTVRDARDKKLGYFRRFLLKQAVKRRRDLLPYREFFERL